MWRWRLSREWGQGARKQCWPLSTAIREVTLEMTLSDHLKTVREKHPGSATAQSSSKHKVRRVPRHIWATGWSSRGWTGTHRGRQRRRGGRGNRSSKLYRTIQRELTFTLRVMENHWRPLGRSGVIGLQFEKAHSTWLVHTYVWGGERQKGQRPGRRPPPQPRWEARVLTPGQWWSVWPSSYILGELER